MPKFALCNSNQNSCATRWAPVQLEMDLGLGHVRSFVNVPFLTVVLPVGQCTPMIHHCISQQRHILTDPLVVDEYVSVQVTRGTSGQDCRSCLILEGDPVDLPACRATRGLELSASLSVLCARQRHWAAA